MAPRTAVLYRTHASRSSTWRVTWAFFSAHFSGLPEIRSQDSRLRSAYFTTRPPGRILKLKFILLENQATFSLAKLLPFDSAPQKTCYQAQKMSKSDKKYFSYLILLPLVLASKEKPGIGRSITYRVLHAGCQYFFSKLIVICGLNIVSWIPRNGIYKLAITPYPTCEMVENDVKISWRPHGGLKLYSW